MDLKLLVTSFIVLSVFADVAFTADEKWPLVDPDGLYQSYKEKGAWVNWWARNKPSVFSIGRR